jgi:hypothetical protein
MLPLLNAIYSAFTSSGALTAAFPGGLHRDQAPEGVGMPYLVSQVMESKVHYGFGGPYRAQTRIRFSAYAVGHDAAAALADVVASVFDDAALTLSSGTHAGTTRLDEPVPKLHHHDAEGNDVWEWGVGYEFSVLL